MTINIESGTPVTPEKPSLKKIKSTHEVTITWKKAKNVSGYRILRREKNKSEASWKAIATVSSSRTSYTDSTGLIKKSYLYTVQSYTFRNGKKIYSKYNTKGLTGTAKLKRPAVKKPQKDVVINLMWDEVPGADGYRIYRRRKSPNGQNWEILNFPGCITQTKLLFPKQSMIMQSAHTVSLAAKFLWVITAPPDTSARLQFQRSA